MSRGPGARLGDVRAPGEDEARARAWALARAAHAERRPRRPRRRAAVPLCAAAVALAVGVMASTAAGSTVAGWLQDRVRDAVGERDRAPDRDRLPGGGRLLTSSGGGAVVAGGGTAPRRLLGSVDAATWSPHGRFVAAARGSELIAVDMAGRRRWSVLAPAAVRHPRWAPTGFRVAYLAGGALRVVAGDGSGDRRVGPAGPAGPAWRPGHGHEIAFADPRGRVVLADLDARRVLWRSRPHRPPRLLTWSADGRRLLAVAARRSYVFTGAGGLVRHTAAPAGTANVAAAFAGRSRDYAVVRTGRDGTSRVVLVRARGGAVGAGRRRFLFGVPGPIRGLAWSPHARWLAVVVSRADAVVLLRPGPGGLAAARSLDRAARRLGGGSAVRLEGWCCAPARPPGPG